MQAMGTSLAGVIESLISSRVCWRATGAYQQESLISAPRVIFGNSFGSLFIRSNIWNVTSVLWIPYTSLISPHSRKWGVPDFFWRGWWWMEYSAPIMKSPRYNADVLSWRSVLCCADIFIVRRMKTNAKQHFRRSFFGCWFPHSTIFMKAYFALLIIHTIYLFMFDFNSVHFGCTYRVKPVKTPHARYNNDSKAVRRSWTKKVSAFPATRFEINRTLRQYPHFLILKSHEHYYRFFELWLIFFYFHCIFPLRVK